MDLQLKDKVVLVTGGAKGIGAAIVRAVSAEGAIPVVVDNDPEAGGQLRAELQASGAIGDLIVRDLCSPDNCAKAVDAAVRAFGRFDALINNAGVNDKVGLEQGSPEQYVGSLSRNLFHYYNMAHYALPHLKKSRGSIVNVASKTAITGKAGHPDMPLPREQFSP